MGSYETQGYSQGARSPTFYTDSSDISVKHIRPMMDHYYTSSYPANAAYWQQGAIDTRFKVGDQTLYSMIYGDNQYFQSRRFFFNLIRRHIMMIAGYQRKNRKSTITVPNLDYDQIADDYNSVLRWCEDRDGFQEYFSQAFENCLTTGMSLLHLYPDYTHDPINCDLYTDQVAYCNFLIDPYFRKQSLEDCNFIWRRRWVTKNAAKTLIPGRDKEIDRLSTSGMKDGRFPLQAELINLDTNKLFTYDEFHYRTTREAKMILDPKTGETTEWTDEGEDSEDILKMTLRMQPWLKVTKMQVPTVKLALCLGNEVMYHGPNLLEIDSYPMVPLLCYHEPDIQSYAWRVQGVVRNLRDAQYLYNMRKVIELDILQSQINSGWIYPIDKVVDPKAFRQNGQGFLVPLKAGATPQDIQRIDPPSIPASMMELSRALSEDITKISGVNEELLGSATDDKAAVLGMLRQGAGLTTLQTILDKADYSQRLYGKIRLEAIRKKFSKNKIKQILGRDPDPRFFSPNSMKFSIAVEEGNYSATQRQFELQQLLDFRQMGMQVADKTIWRASFLTNKKQAEEDAAEQSRQQSAIQQQQFQLESEKQRAENIATYARARSELAKEKDLMAETQERVAKIGDLHAEAEVKKAQSDLDLVKMMIALEDMDLENIKKSLEIAQAIKLYNEKGSINQIEQPIS